MEARGAAGTKGKWTRQRPASACRKFEAALMTTAILCAGFVSGCAGLVSSGGKTTTGLAAFQLNPTALNFGNVGVGKKATQTIAVANTGTMPVSITQATLSNPQFSLTGVTLPMSIGTGQSGNFTVGVTPSTAGTVTGTLTVQGSDGATPAVVNLSATAVAPAPQISLSSTSVQFGTVGIGATSNLSLMISNTGNADLTISLISLTGAEFAVSGIATPKSVVAGQSAQVALSFQPKVDGAAAATLSITSNDPVNPTMSVTLGGTGSTASFAQLEANPTSLSFGSVSTGGNSTKQITLTNTGTTVVHISSISGSGAGFTTNGITTPFSLNAAASTILNVVFAPTTGGSVSGNVSVTSDATNSPLSISLTGTGAQPGLSITPTSFTFGSVLDGQTKSQTFTLTNTGNAALTISQLGVSGTGYSLSGLATPATIAVGASATFSATFAPTTAGSLPGTITITSNAPTSPSTVVLTGTGTAAQPGVSITPASFTFGSVVDGQTKSQTFTVTNTGNASLSISQLSVSGAGYTLSGLATPTTVAAGASTTFSATFAPTTAGSLPGTITITSNAPTSPSTVALTGTGTTAQPGVSITPASFAFGSVVDGQTKSQTFTVTNTGSGALTISQLTVSGASYSLSGLVTPSTVAPGASTTFSATFAPTTAASLPGTITITSNAPTSPSTVALSGTGVAGTVVLSANPTSLAFGNVNAGVTSSKSVTLTNNGTGNVTISQITVSAKDVTTSGVTTPVTLTPGQAKTLNVVFDPAAQETVSGNITVTNSQGTSTVVAVNGTGVQAGITLTPSSANFGSVTVGATNSQTIQIRNTGNGVLTITQANVTGTGFSVAGLTLPLSINPGLTSTFNAQYQPPAAGSASGSISLVSNAAVSPSVVTLTGTGVAATQTLSLSTTSLSFGNVNTGTSSTQTVSVTNTGNANVQISQITVAGAGYSLSGASAPISLTPSQRLTFSVIFNPAVAGSASGTVTITSNATGSPATITLSGTGVVATTHTVSLAWNASTSVVSGYNVYRSITSGTGYTKLNGGLVVAVGYTDSTVANGTTYYYVTTAVDASGNESADSNEAVAVIP